MNTTIDLPPPIERLAFSASETCATLGISKVSLWRLERLGLLHPVRYLRHRIYPRTEILRFLSGAPLKKETK